MVKKVAEQTEEEELKKKEQDPHRLAVLHQVHPLELHLGGDAQEAVVLEGAEQESGPEDGPEEDGKGGGNMHSQHQPGEAHVAWGQCRGEKGKGGAE